MKTITVGKNAREKMNGRRIICYKCNGCFEITSEDNLTYHSDQREGNYYSIKCPTPGCNVPLVAKQHESTSSYFER